MSTETPVVNFAKKQLEERIRGRTAFIKYLNNFIPLARADAQIDKAARMHAVKNLLGASTLDKIEPWNPEVVDTLVNYLAKEYPHELRSWISDSARLKLDPKKVEEVEAVARKLFGDAP